MNSASDEPRRIRETDDLRSLLAGAGTLLDAADFSNSAIEYRVILREPGLRHHPLEHSTALIGLGAALLHLGMAEPPGSRGDKMLQEAVTLLTEAKALCRAEGLVAPVTATRDLALAHLRLFQRTQKSSHIMAAHFVLEDLPDGLDEARGAEIAALRDRLAAARTPVR